MADVPKLSGNTTVPRWNDSLKAYMTEVFGARGATLHYLIRESDVVPAAGPLTVLTEKKYPTLRRASISRLVRWHGCPTPMLCILMTIRNSA